MSSINQAPAYFLAGLLLMSTPSIGANTGAFAADDHVDLELRLAAQGGTVREQANAIRNSINEAKKIFDHLESGNITDAQKALSTRADGNDGPKTRDAAVGSVQKLIGQLRDLSLGMDNQDLKADLQVAIDQLDQSLKDIDKQQFYSDVLEGLKRLQEIYDQLDLDTSKNLSNGIPKNTVSSPSQGQDSSRFKFLIWESYASLVTFLVSLATLITVIFMPLGNHRNSDHDRENSGRILRRLNHIIETSLPELLREDRKSDAGISEIKSLLTESLEFLREDRKSDARISEIKSLLTESLELLREDRKSDAGIQGTKVNSSSDSLSNSVRQLVQAFNHGSRPFSNTLRDSDFKYHQVSETSESYDRRRRSVSVEDVILERGRTFWVVEIEGSSYLFPARTTVPVYWIDPVNALFKGFNRTTDDFELLQPARVSKFYGEEKWKLDKQGELRHSC